MSRFAHTIRRAALILTLAAAAGTVTVACEDKKEEKKDEKQAASAIFGEKIGVPEEAGGTLGTPLAEWANFDGEERLKSKAFAKVSYRIEDDEYTGTVDRVRIRLEGDDDLLAAATAAWGEPVSHDDGHFWFDEAAGLRAALEVGDAPSEGYLEIRTYTPFGALFGDQGTLALEPEGGALGKKPEVLAGIAGYKEDDDSIFVSLQPLMFDKYWTRVHVSTNDTDGSIDEFRFTGAAPGEHRTALETAMAASFPTVVDGKDMDKPMKVYFAPESGRRATLKDSYSEGEIEVEVESYLPVATLVGGDEDKNAFSFETDTLGKPWLGNLDEAKYGELKNKEYDWVDVAPTEFESHSTNASVEFTDGKASRLRFSIGYAMNPETGKDAILAAFKEAYGEPTEGEKKFSDSKVYVFPTTPPTALIEGTVGDRWDVEVPAPETE